MVNTSLLYASNTMLTFIVFILVLITTPFYKQGLPLRIASWHGKVSNFQARFFCRIHCKVEGADNIPSEPVVFMIKHQSAWETMTLAGILPNICFVVKKELLRIPIYGWTMCLLRYIPIQRQQGVKAFKQVLREGKNRINNGTSIAIFPEGTRTDVGVFPKFHKSAVALAKASKVKIVPIALNSGSVWKKGYFTKGPGQITVVIGKPIATDIFSVNELNQLVHDWIMGMTKKIQS